MNRYINLAVSAILTVSFAFTAFGADKNFPFVDIDQNSWYYTYVEDAYNKGIIAGTSEKIFAPDVTLTRAMASSLIYRMYGSPEVKYSRQFPDVEEGAWYTDGILWAKENGIVSGYDDGTFCPGWAMTVEQFASVLYRLADTPENTGDLNTLDKYSDNFMVSTYARPAMIWAEKNRMLQGATLHPTSAITRAEAAKMLSVFTTINDFKAIKNLGAISSYINENYDSTFDMTKYSYHTDDSGDIYLYYMVKGYRSTFGYRAVMSGDKLMRIDMIGIMNPYFLASDIVEPKISDEELRRLALEAENNEFAVESQTITKYFNMDNLKFVFEVETTYIDDGGAYFTKLYTYEP